MNTPPEDSRSLLDLLSELMRDLVTLVRQEIALARREFGEKLRQLGVGAASLGVGGLLTFVALLVLLDALVLKLSERWSPAVTAAVIGLAVVATGMFLLLRGKATLGKTRLIPPRAAESLSRSTALLRDRSG